MFIINGKKVTEGQWREYIARRQSIFGAPDWSNMSFRVVGDDGPGGYMEGKKGGEDLGALPEWARKRALAAARKAGISLEGRRLVSHGKFDDPNSWVEGYDEMVARAAAQNKNVTPGTTLRKSHQAEPVPRPQRVKLADDLAREMIHKEVAEDPALKEKKVAELKEMVTDKYGNR